MCMCLVLHVLLNVEANGTRMDQSTSQPDSSSPSSATGQENRVEQPHVQIG